jgi:predicted transport protein
MQIFKIDNNKLNELNEKPFKLEKEIQAIFENNLNEIMNLQLVKSEFVIKNKRIDTLAFDQQNNAFIIIEYKRDRNLSVVDQGFTYLSLMLENKAEFIVEYNERLNKNLKREEVDWTQSRVVFVSTSFTEYQIQATNFKDIGIELYEVKQFDNNLISINPIKKNASAESIKSIADKNKEFDVVFSEIKVFTEQDHLSTASDELAELYEKYRDAILNLDSNIEIKPQKFYIALKKDNTNIACLELQKKRLKIFVGAKIGTLDDSKGIAKDVSKIGHYGTGDYEIHIEDDKDLEYIMSLIKQVIKK